MIRFIQSLPNIVDRMIARISSPSIQDLLIRIITAEEGGGVPGVVEWLHDEGLIPRLISYLSPHHAPFMHVIASDLMKSIINLCAPTPFNPHGGNAMEQQAGQGVQSPGMRDTRLVRDLASRTSLLTLIGFMLDKVELSDRDWKGVNGDPSPADPFITHPLPSIASAASSLSHICNILVELVRRNNSDFSEPHLFHTLRNRLMSVRLLNHPTEGEGEEEERKKMEEVMEELSSKMGIVHLGNLLDIVCDRFEELQGLINAPRSHVSTPCSRLQFKLTSQDRVAPKPSSNVLTMERFRVIELYAELLHSSNMSIVNRAVGTGPVYTADGILTGGLSGLEALGEAIDGDRIGDGDEGIPEDKVTQARELPVSSASTDASFGSEDVVSEDEKMLEDIEEDTTPGASPSASGTLETPHPAANPPPPSQADVARLRDVLTSESRLQPAGTSDIASASHAAIATSTAAPSVASFHENEREQDLPGLAERPNDDPMALGDRLKSMYIQHRVLPAVVDLFFEFPSHNFLHHVIYDLLQQILNGRIRPGLNRELAIELIRKAKLIERILDAQRLNDQLV